MPSLFSVLVDGYGTVLWSGIILLTGVVPQNKLVLQVLPFKLVQKTKTRLPPQLRSTSTHFSRALPQETRPGQNQICMPFLCYKILYFSCTLP